MFCTCNKQHGARRAHHGNAQSRFLLLELCIMRPCAPTNLIAIRRELFFFVFFVHVEVFWHHWDEGVSFPLQFAPLLFNDEGLRHLTVMSHWLVALQWLFSRPSDGWNKKKEKSIVIVGRKMTEMNDDKVYKHSLPGQTPARCLHTLPCTWYILVLYIGNMQFPLYNHCWIKKTQT